MKHFILLFLTSASLLGQTVINNLAVKTNFFLQNPAGIGEVLTLKNAVSGQVVYNATKASNVAALKALSTNAVLNGSIVATLGYYSEGDGGNGAYRYDSGSSATADDGLVIAPNHGVGRYILLHNRSVSLRQFGANGTSVADTIAVSNAVVDLNAGNISTLFVPPGDYYIDNIYSLTGKDITISGAGSGSRLIANRRLVPSGGTIFFRIYGTNVSFTDLSITRATNTNNPADGTAYSCFWRIENTAKNTTIARCKIDGNASGQVTRSGYYYVEVEANGLSATTGGPFGINILDNDWTDTTSRAINLLGVSQLLIRGNSFYACGVNNYTGAGGTLNPGTCIEVQSYDVGGIIHPSRNVVIEQNRFTYWGDGAINTGGTYNMTISGNTCDGAATIGLDPAGAHDENGISIFGGFQTSIVNNSVDRVKGYGVLLQTRATAGYIKNIGDIAIVGNTLLGGVSPGGTGLQTSIGIQTTTSNSVAKNITVIGNTYRTTDSIGAGIAFAISGSSPGAVLSNVVVNANVIQGSGPSSSVRGITWSDNSGVVDGLTINGNIFSDLNVGMLLVLGSWPSGTVAFGNQFRNVTTRSSSEADLSLYSGSGFVGIRPVGSSTSAAANGAIRLPNAQEIRWKNAANSGDIIGIGVNSVDEVEVGGPAVLNVKPTGSKYVRTSSTTAFGFSFPSVVNVSTNATLSPSAATLQVVGNGGAVTLNATTGITAGTINGQILIVVGTSDANTVTLPASGNIYLDGGVACTLGRGDTIMLQYYPSGTGFNAGWRELSRRDNPQ